jgi:flavin reductase (DIM6/NTAB) family NADH-FMN oxidoreductase RutF
MQQEQRLMSTTFAPETDAIAFRNALGMYATGVTVITTITAEGPMGITANSFASVSLDPPLVLWSPARNSRRFEHFANTERFAIHVLGADQRHIGDGFTRSKTAFEGFSWHANHAGVPIIDDTLACFECNFEAAHDAGDHTIILGRVTKTHHRPGAPLVFHGGAYGEFRNGA